MEDTENRIVLNALNADTSLFRGGGHAILIWCPEEFAVKHKSLDCIYVLQWHSFVSHIILTSYLVQWCVILPVRMVPVSTTTLALVQMDTMDQPALNWVCILSQY